ncbi:MAG: hypothetical protein JSW47_16670 [Phycisphaerales bacterium]|nr:MAG: hypothetical protein JSW47_16670 [Phycisphaerales bacterium]
MNRDILGYIVMSIMATVGVLAVFIGAARNNPDAILVGILTGVYATIIGTTTSAKRELKKELEQIRGEIKNLPGMAR